MWQTEIERQHVGVEGRRFSAADLHELAALSVEEEDEALRAVAFVLTYIYDISVVYIVIGCGLIGAIQSMIEYWRKR